MPSLGFPELILILVIALIIFGPGKLPSVGASIGKALNEFKKASRELTKDDVDDKISQEEKSS
ncbi:twin-arginine translocase TatA/TatE family subunit [Clostridium chromiireducens]|uniref:Sec-independent protein translocase protein TatA n=1 Tax=Clostridium chromiireducens TaxID=225345 RepID=A0A964W347_9CLOT|nr:twin-arginine translocase TatA/TatE family subunit [Clostridium chromiireducens]MVX65181.1 twin-arginine translocase TatA/TatE family subunit [Clostridium chromiireducens]